MMKVLVAYATKYHSSAEIANAIGEVLQQTEGLKVKVMPVELVIDVAVYDAVVLGSAVYAGHWRSSASDFLKNNEVELAKRPVWLFSSGPTGEGDPEALMKGWKFPEALQPVIERIHPRDVALFHGKLDPKELQIWERVIIKGVKAPTGDYRDWEMIREWALGIAQALEKEMQAQAAVPAQVEMTEAT